MGIGCMTVLECIILFFNRFMAVGDITASFWNFVMDGRDECILYLLRPCVFAMMSLSTWFDHVVAIAVYILK